MFELQADVIVTSEFVSVIRGWLWDVGRGRSQNAMMISMKRSQMGLIVITQRSNVLLKQGLWFGRASRGRTNLLS